MLDIMSCFTTIFGFISPKKSMSSVGDVIPIAADKEEEDKIEEGIRALDRFDVVVVVVIVVYADDVLVLDVDILDDDNDDEVDVCVTVSLVLIWLSISWLLDWISGDDGISFDIFSLLFSLFFSLSVSSQFSSNSSQSLLLSIEIIATSEEEET